MNTTGRNPATWSAALACVCIGSLLCSCEDHEIARLRAERQTREAMAELKRMHREELKLLSQRITALEENNGSLALQLEQARTLEPPPPATRGGLVETAPPVNEEPTPETRKIASYQQHGLNGVPAQVAAEIVRKARREQRSWLALEDIEAEGAGYRAVQAFAASQTKMLREDRDQLVAAAMRQHPDDWSEMSRFIDAQVDAWTILEEWKVKGVPGLETWESEAVLCGALESFPFDWACALDAVAKASRGQIAGRDRPRVSRRH